ncbi:Efflux pump periplasmic linker BepF [Aeoliella mucimassa]|uniref:Efflux pump periplasmic linker BepF n=2 Tax=Aeoliella mucimassa TaxID=2527972 RepID=A0A518AIF5_9BACT|nr:Efflux pump periplasmic linker BepF [Aeoliella mucimassa]
MVLALLVSPLSGCRKNKYIAPPPPEVDVATPVVQEIRRELEFTGSTTSFKTVKIEARVKGFLEEIRFQEGSNQIKKDDVLYIIDQEPFKVKVQQAQAALKVAEAMQSDADAQMASAKAEQKNAQTQLARSRAAGGAVTEAEIDEQVAAVGIADAKISAAEAARASADSQHTAAEAALAEAELDLEYTTVRSPIDGRITETLVDVGNLVGANEATHLATIVQNNPLYVYFNISESDILQWLEWQRQGLVAHRPEEMDERKTPIKLALADEDDFPHEGYVDYADPVIDQSSGTLRVRAVFKNDDNAIPAGAFVRIRVPLFPEQAMLVDDPAVARDQAGPYVLVVGEDNKVERRSVKVGDRYQGMRVIYDGLSTDDRIVVNGLQYARPGREVAPQLTEMQQPKPAAAAAATADDSSTTEEQTPESTESSSSDNE